MRITDISDFDYLIFENRNRDYGAYYLRRKYNYVVVGGIIFASVFAACAVILPFVIKGPSERVLSGGYGYINVQMDVLEHPPEEVIIPPVPPPPQAASTQEIVKYVPPVVVDSVIINEPPPATIDDALAHVGEEQMDQGGSIFGDDLLGEGDGFGAEEPYFFVEVMPAFRGGGLDNFRDWINRRTNYPQEAIDAKIRGTVFLTFIVEKDGSVSNITVLKGVHPLLDNEAVRTISESPKWSPGLQRGEPVRVRFQIPLSFIL